VDAAEGRIVTTSGSSHQGEAPAARLVLPLGALNRESLPLAGGKAANLGELIRAGFSVPAGFCVTTAAYADAAASAGLDAVIGTAPADELAERARLALLALPLPVNLVVAIRSAYAELSGAESADVAVRSSATAEDLPDASFAGQQDTFLHIQADAALLDAIRRCWASLWTDRAVAYRAANRIDQRVVLLAVVVQRMVPARTAGVLFTANPLTGRRAETVIDAALGLGEAVVSGSVNPDHFVVDPAAGRILASRPGGGAAAEACLNTAQVLELAQLGRSVAAHFGSPQDLEWAFDPDGKLWLLQARPITTLFPLPAGARADEHHLDVYFSANVAQGVLGPFTPAGLAALRRLAAGVGRLFGFQIDPERGPDAATEAAGRLYLRVTPMLRQPLGRRILLFMLSFMEPLSGEAIRSVLADPRLASVPGSAGVGVRRLAGILLRTRLPFRLGAALRRPSASAAAVLGAVDTLLASAAGQPASARAALELAEALFERFPPVLARLFPLVLAGVGSLGLARRLAAQIGAGDDVLLATRGLPGNPTTIMNLDLWALATRLRNSPADRQILIEQSAAELADRYRRGLLPPQTQRDVATFLDRHGVRGVAEIDLGVPRWRDEPTHVFGVLSNYLRLDSDQLAPDVQFRQAAAQAEAAIEQLVRRARATGPLGPLRAGLLRFLLSRVRALGGLREWPKLSAVRVLGRCRELLLQVGAELVSAGRLEQPEDVMFLDFAEARRALDGVDSRSLVAQRRARYLQEQHRRRVPRVLLSDGTALDGGIPVGDPSAPSDHNVLLRGTPASPGTFRGRARVIQDPSGARLEPGEILVAPSTDPGWTPLFLTAGALIMEMGGLMSHGSVVAREYGIPAVVGALGATSLIETGQWLMVDGARGTVSLTDAVESS
jgi:pyruvate,water dikinase